MARKLTDKQEAYKNNRIKGMGVSASYRAAYDSKGMNDRTASIEANKLEQDPRIAPEIAKAKKSVTDKVLVTVEDVVRGLLKETKEEVEGSTPGSRINAWKILSDHTGSFDANKQKLEHSGEIHITHEQWLDTLD
ncbi:MAG: hypothetical protein JKY50_00790 [Oleispira sp.]|nr:hypothetical protein [Oleispira sp.]